MVPSSAPASSSHKKNLHSLLSTNLKKLTIIPPNSNTSTSATPDLDFSEVFGPLTPHPNQSLSSPSSASTTSTSTSTSTSGPFHGDPLVIHNRSHSFVGPSPRYTLSSSLPFQIQEDDDDDDEDDEVGVSAAAAPEEEYGQQSGGAVAKEGVIVGSVSDDKIGPGDFEILRVVGRGEHLGRCLR